MFVEASAVRSVGVGEWEATFDASWFQGPGAFGGLTAAVLTRAMAEAAGGLPLQSFTAQFCAPVQAGPARIEARVERAGSTTRFCSARLWQGQRVQAHAVAVFGRPRVGDLDGGDEPMPDAPPFESLPSLPEAPGLLPVFLRHFDLRFAAGDLPFSGGEGRASAWVRPLDPAPIDAALVLASLDVLPPSLLLRSRAPRPMGTLSMTAYLRDPAPDLAPGTPLLVHTAHRTTRGGYSDEDDWLYAPDGRLLGVMRQLYALVR